MELKGAESLKSKHPEPLKTMLSVLKTRSHEPTTTNALTGSEIIGNYSNLGRVHCVSVDPGGLLLKYGGAW